MPLNVYLLRGLRIFAIVFPFCSYVPVCLSILQYSSDPLHVSELYHTLPHVVKQFATTTNNTTTTTTATTINFTSTAPIINNVGYDYGYGQS